MVAIELVYFHAQGAEAFTQTVNFAFHVRAELRRLIADDDVTKIRQPPGDLRIRQRRQRGVAQRDNNLARRLRRHAEAVLVACLVVKVAGFRHRRRIGQQRDPLGRSQSKHTQAAGADVGQRRGDRSEH